jgi:hypothetical protein
LDILNGEIKNKYPIKIVFNKNKKNLNKETKKVIENFI